MKRFFVIAAAVVASMLSFSSCQEKMENRVLSAPERQDRIDATLSEFLNATSASELGFLVDDYARFLETYILPENYDFSALGELGEVVDFVSELDADKRVAYTNLTILLSNLDGELDFGESAVTFTPREGSAKTVLSFELQGKPFVVTLEQVGKRSIIDFGEYYNSIWTDVPDEEGNNHSTHITDIESVKLELPEQILVTVTKDGAAYASAKLVPSYSISEGGVDFTKDYAGADIEISLKNYQLIIDKTRLDLNAELATVNARLLKNGQELLAAHASLGIGLRREDYEYDNTFDTDITPVKAHKLNLSLTLMQDVEFRLYCASLAQAAIILDGDSPYINQHVKAEELDKEGWSRKIDALNSICSVNLYFTDNSAAQGAIKLTPSYDYDDYDEDYSYEVVPMVVYPDGTRLLLEEAALGFDTSSVYDFIIDWQNWIESVAPKAPEAPELD